MHIVRDGGELVLRTPAKANLFLEVVGRRGDGYHDLVTIMQAVDLCDELRIAAAPDDTIGFRCDDPRVPGDSTNLVVRAAEALRREAGCRLGACLSLSKRVPLGGGLGGGSANAAGTLLGLNEFWRLGASRQDLHRVAAGLGSDVNLFLEGGTALCLGRGEQVIPIANALGLRYVLVLPRMGVATPEAFRAMPKFLTPFLKDASIALAALARSDFSGLCRSLFNRLEEPVFELYPPLADVKRQLERVRPGQVLMSGSGSTFFCVCQDDACAMEVETEMGRLGVGRVHRVAGL